MFNFKKIGKKVLSSVLGATLAMGSFLNTQIVKADEPYIQKYWDPYTMLSLAGFILGEDEKDEKDDIEKLKKEFEKEFEKALNTKLSNEKLSDLGLQKSQKRILGIENDLVVAENGLKSQLEDELKGKKEVYDAVEEFITAEEADLGKLNSISKLEEIKKIGDGLECKIATFGIGGTKKAIVGVSVPEIKYFKSSHMEKIIDDLKIAQTDQLGTRDFKDVYLVIRPKENDKIFYIDYDIMENLKNATVVTPGAKFYKNVTISENSTLIANGADFRENFTVNGNLTANGADFWKNVTVNGNLTANGAAFGSHYGIFETVTVNGNLTANGAMFCGNIPVEEGGHLTANGAMFCGNIPVEEGGHLTANGAEFFKDVTVNGNLTANGATFFKDVTVNGNLTANGATFWKKVNVNGYNLTVDISNAEFHYGVKCTINAQNSNINLTGWEFGYIDFERTCANLEITVDNNEVDEFYQEYKDKVLGSKVFESINKVTWEEIIILNYQCQNNSEYFLNEFKKLKQQKEEEEQQQDIINNGNGKTNTKGTNKSTTSTSQQQQPQPQPQQQQQPQNNNGNKIVTTTNSNNEINNIIFKEEGFVKKHPVISCTIGTLLTGIVVTPLVVFRNKIIKGIESIFGKKQIKKPVAKRIKATN